MKAIYKVLIVVACLALLVVFVLSFALFIPSNSKYIAHRGYNGVDNTLSSFKNASKFAGVECDVRVTNDGVFVLSHDDEIVFDDGTKLSIKNSDFDSLNSKTFSNGNKICTFIDFLKVCDKNNFIAFIELKTVCSVEQCEQIIDLITQYYDANNCIFQSFESSNLLNIKSISNITLFYLFSNDNEENRNFCITNDINASIHWSSCSTSFINKMHKNNLKVACWTVKEIISNFWAKVVGADYIITDIYAK